MRMLFVDYSSSFNTIVPSKLVVKLQALGLNNSLCSWILDFLTGRRQVVRVDSNIFSPLTLNTGAPQGCVLSPLLYSLYTHDCVATHSSNVIIKFADDTMVVGLITDDDESAYREEVHTLTNWCHNNNLSLNISKTKELVVDFRRRTSVHLPHHHRQDSSGAGQQLQVTWRSHHRGSHLDYSHTVSSEEGPPATLLPQATEEIWPGSKILRQFYICTVESILTGCNHRLVWELQPLSLESPAENSFRRPSTSSEMSFPPSRTSTPSDV